jgi:glyoxylase-like metal-dependent hydrolase (beta-lactamase superfamily II)
MIQHENTAFLVDPRRDVEVYLEDLEAEELSLKGILLTHIHADFVSGHKELIDRTGATVYMGPGTRDRCQFPLTELQDNESIDMSGKFSVRALHTPGHTPESMTFLLVNKMDQEKPLAAFTGDTLFIGSVGRPDLVGSLNFTAEYMSEMLYNSLEKKIKVLPEDVVVLTLSVYLSLHFYS